jgi:DNA-binding response OmpR family regulator
MARPTILVAEPEPGQALSVRKLVLETAKFNVLTAHSSNEALEVFHLFPMLDAVILVNDPVLDCYSVSKYIKNKTPKIPIIALSARIGDRCGFADYNLSSHEPEELLELVRSLLGDPRNLSADQREQQVREA